jgi:hypothetical protein
VKLVLKLEPLLAAQAKSQQGRRNDIPKKSAESFKPIETRTELAKRAGVSHDTVSKVVKITTKGVVDFQCSLLRTIPDNATIPENQTNPVNRMTQGYGGE